MNGNHSVFYLPRPAPWWDLPAHITAANLGWWIAGALVAGIVLARVRGRARRPM